MPLIQLELSLEDPVRQTSPPLEHGYRLIEDFLKCHRHPSLCQCGLQKTVWELDRPFGHMYTAYG